MTKYYALPVTTKYWKPGEKYLNNILDAIEKATEFIQGMTYEQFAQDAKTAFAVIRALGIVGEATKYLGDKWRGCATS